MIIYKATNTINGKYYIGKTKNTLENRIKSHKLASRKKDWLFYRAINKYGFYNFTWEVIIECDDVDQLNQLEKKYISENHNGYNIAKGGNGGDTISNNPNLNKIKENASKLHKGKILSEEHKRKISNAHKGKNKPWAKDTAKKMSEGNIGKESKTKGSKLTEEHKQKISKGNKGKTKIFTEEHKQNLAKAKEGFKNPNKGKSYEEIMGVEKALEFKKRQSEMRKGRVVSEETKKKISDYHKNKKMEKKVLKIQEHLRKFGLEATVDKFKLKVKSYKHKTLFKYDQLISPTMMAIPEVQECRGLILENGTWNVLSMAFEKFFNYQEGNAAKIDWNTASILEKLDGTLIQVYWDWHKNTWFAGTTGTSEGEGEVNNKMGTTFNDLFWDTVNNKYGFNECLLDKDHIYVFELTTPYNIVVKPHGESSATILTVRNRETLVELSGKDLEMVAISLGLPLVKKFDLNAKDVGALLRTFEGMPWSEEGYVVVDGNFNRVKVKNPAYLAVHHLKGKTAEHNILTIVKTNEIEEFASTFPERKEELLRLKENYDLLTAKLNLVWDELKLSRPKNITKEEQKKYASAVFSACKKYNVETFSGMYFGLAQYKVNSVEEFLLNYDDKSLYRLL